MTDFNRFPDLSMMPAPLRTLLSAAVVLAAAGCAPGGRSPAVNPGPPRHAAEEPAHDAASGPGDTAAAVDAGRVAPDPGDDPTRPRVRPPADGRGWRLALPAIAGPGVRVEIEPGRRSALRLGTAAAARAAPSAAQPDVYALEPAPDAEPRSPRHAVIAFRTPGSAGDGLVALVAHVGPDGRPAAGGFCIDIRGGVRGSSDRYAFEHPARRLTLATAAGGALPGGRDDDAGAAREVRVWPAAVREVADADAALVARFASADDEATLRAWFRSEAGDDLLTAAVPASGGRPARRLLVVGREAGSAANPFITVYEMPSPDAPPILAVTSRLLNRGRTRVVTVATEVALHTLVQHLVDEPHISPDLSLDGRFAAVTRTADGTLIDAYLGDGNALVLPELTLDAQSAGETSAYARP